MVIDKFESIYLLGRIIQKKKPIEYGHQVGFAYSSDLTRFVSPFISIQTSLRYEKKHKGFMGKKKLKKVADIR